MKKITLFEEGKTYMYSVELKVKDGYTYTENSTAEVNGIKASIVIKTQSGLLIPAVKTITPVSPVIRKEIELVEINGATLTFKDGDKPVFTGSTPNGAPYTMVYEAWKTDGEGISSNEEFNGDKHLAAWGGKLKNRCVFFCNEFGTLPKIESAEMMFSASRSRRLQIVPIIQSFAQLEKNYGKTNSAEFATTK